MIGHNMGFYMSNSISSDNHSLAELGWSNLFQQQLSLEEWESYTPARIVMQHKSGLVVLTEDGPLTIKMQARAEAAQLRLTVGDWLLLDEKFRIRRLLNRISVFSRKSAGTKVDEQLIAANVDTLFIVCSLNQDFNLNRVERYLVLANKAGVEPVVVLTKADLCESQEMINEAISQIQGLDPFLMTVAVNALDTSCKIQLAPWCKTGKTLALLGSSGVGKSTLINTFLEGSAQDTRAIREADSKGRHTTTGRSLHLLKSEDSSYGGLVLDTPGMRELQLVNSEEGIEETFTDITQLTQLCKFGDCHHNSEPGCAVQAAIESGELPLRRLQSFHKLQREDEFNSASLADKRDKDRKLGKMIRSVQTDMRKLKKR
jgi:ribosome biogenesis GTPase / thiamine phosphate phosphatase